MLQAYKEVPFQSWLRSELEGIDSVLFSKLFGLVSLGIMLIVVIDARLYFCFSLLG